MGAILVVRSVTIETVHDTSSLVQGRHNGIRYSVN